MNQLPVLQVATPHKNKILFFAFASVVYMTLKTHVNGERCCNYRWCWFLLNANSAMTTL